MKENQHLLIRQLRHPHDIDNGGTLLLCAVQVGNEEVVDQLLQVGADLFASSTARPEFEARRQLQLEVHENNRMQLQSQARAKEIYVRRDYNVGDIWGKIQEIATPCSPERAQKHRQTPS